MVTMRTLAYYHPRAYLTNNIYVIAIGGKNARGASMASLGECERFLLSKGEIYFLTQFSNKQKMTRMKSIAAYATARVLRAASPSCNSAVTGLKPSACATISTPKSKQTRWSTFSARKPNAGKSLHETR